MVIGLSGKYCAGKNAAAAVFEEIGIPTIDVDRLGHLALESEVDRIEKEFGPSVIKTESACGGEPARRVVDRRALGGIVFSDPGRLRALEKITHPWMVDETRRRIESFTGEGAKHVVVNAAILLHMGLHQLCDAVVWVDAPLGLRIRRALSRDSLNLRAVLKRIYTQRTLKAQPLAEYVDIYRIENKSGIDFLKKEISMVLDSMEQKGKNGR